MGQLQLFYARVVLRNAVLSIANIFSTMSMRAVFALCAVLNYIDVDLACNCTLVQRRGQPLMVLKQTAS